MAEGLGDDGKSLFVNADLALYRAKDIDDAVRITNSIQTYQGQGHSCGIYSTNDNNIMKLANGTKTSRIMVNQPQAPSNSGNLWNGMRQTFSLGCGSWGGNSISENLDFKHLMNVSRIGQIIEGKKVPTDEEIWA